MGNIKHFTCQDQDEHYDVSWPVNGFQNLDNVSCYANATIQCDFRCTVITTKLITQCTTDVLKMLYISYKQNKEVLNTFQIRQFVGTQFARNVQQDASEFLSAHCMKSKPFEVFWNISYYQRYAVLRVTLQELPMILTLLCRFHCLLQ